MVFRPDRAIAGPQAPLSGQEPPPVLLSRPADPPPALGHVAGTEPVIALRSEIVSRHERDEARGPGSQRVRLRAWMGRVSGRADRRLLLRVVATTDALVERCDTLGDRLGSLESIVSEVVEAYGTELAGLRAEVAHLRALVAAMEHGKGE